MNELKIAQYYRLPETREMGRSFFPTFLDWARQAPEDEPLILSFQDVEFVSPSFIDETIVRLLKEHPELGDRLRLVSVDPFTLRTIRSTLRTRGIQQEIPPASPPEDQTQ